jgi:hypothetical protein
LSKDRENIKDKLLKDWEKNWGILNYRGEIGKRLRKNCKIILEGLGRGQKKVRLLKFGTRTLTGE